MSDLVLVAMVAAITFTTRVAFLVRPRPAHGGILGRFLDVFPLALFVAIATAALVAPEGSPDLEPGLAEDLGDFLRREQDFVFGIRFRVVVRQDGLVVQDEDALVWHATHHVRPAGVNRRIKDASGGGKPHTNTY